MPPTPTPASTLHLHRFLVAASSVGLEGQVSRGHVVKRDAQTPQVHLGVKLLAGGQPQHRSLVHPWVLQHNAVLGHAATCFNRPSFWQYPLLAPSVHYPQMVWGCMCACACARNELICGYANLVHTSSYSVHTHPHTHTHILIPSEDHKPTGLKVDIAIIFRWYGNICLPKIWPLHLFCFELK